MRPDVRSRDTVHRPVTRWLTRPSEPPAKRLRPRTKRATVPQGNGVSSPSQHERTRKSPVVGAHRNSLDRLHALLAVQGTELPHIKTIGGLPIDFCALLDCVTRRGGMWATTEAKQWGAVCSELGIPARCTSRSTQLRILYEKYLFRIEGEFVANGGDPATNDEKEDIRCVCGHTDFDGCLIRCDVCKTWSHTDCLDLEWNEACRIQEEWICERCHTGTAPEKKMAREEEAAWQIALNVKELEMRLAWTTVKGCFRSIRGAWTSRCRRARTLSETVAVLTQFGKHLRPTAMSAEWKYDDWLRDCQRATSPAEVADALLCLEEHIQQGKNEEASWRAHLQKYALPVDDEHAEYEQNHEREREDQDHETRQTLQPVESCLPYFRARILPYQCPSCLQCLSPDLSEVMNHLENCRQKLLSTMGSEALEALEARVQAKQRRVRSFWRTAEERLPPWDHR